MSTAVIFIGCILISVTEVTLADQHQSVSPSAIIALACLFGFLGTVILLSGICYCVRTQRYRDNKRRQEKLAIVSRLFEEHQQASEKAATHNESRADLSRADLSTSVRVFDTTDHTGYSRSETGLKHPVGDSMVVEKPQKYTDWRQSQSHNVTLNGGPMLRDTKYVIKTHNGDTTRSISPTRASATMDRGRSRQRKVIYTNGGSVHNNGNYAVITRSKSAPAVNRTVYKNYVPGPRPVYFTKSHFMAIKQPFSKKYLLPPTRTHYMERPMMKRVINYQAPPQRQVIEVQRPASVHNVVHHHKPEQQRSNVYHVQYTPSSNLSTHRYSNDLEAYQLSNSMSQQSPRIYHTSDSTYHSSNHSPTILTPQPHNFVQYTNTHNTGKVVPAQSWYGNNVYVTRHDSSNSDQDDVFVMQANHPSTTSTYTAVQAVGGVSQSKVEDNYTIVDYVKSNDENKNVLMSTSTPRFAGHDSTALHDLDKLLDSNSSSTSGSGSSSDRSSRERHHSN